MGVVFIVHGSIVSSRFHVYSWHLAPEILQNDIYDSKADLWSTGAVTYTMSVGRNPYNTREQLRRLEDVKFPGTVPCDIKLFIETLLKRDPEERMNPRDFFRATTSQR